MKKHYGILFLAIFFVIQTAFGQITTVPASSGGTVAICQNGSVIFSSTDTPPAGASISWSFPGGVPSSANTIGPHPVAYATPGTYTATLTINGVSSSVNVNVAANTTVPPLNIANNLLQFGYGQTPVATDQPDFYYCGNLLGAYNGNVSFQFTLSSAYPANHQIIVNWGDGTSSTFAGNTTTFNKTYNCSVQTEFVMSFSVVGPNGCVAAASYDIFSGIAPQISVSGNASTHCMPDPYTFTFSNNGVPGTTYTYQFSDGSPVTEITGSFPAQISHEFVIHSCEQTSVITGANGVPQTFINSYAGNLIGTNICGSSFLSIGPIYVSSEPVPLLNVSPTTGFACVEQPVTITNASQPGVMVSAAPQCNELNRFCYNITPSTGWTLVSGNMGDCSDPNWFFWPDNATTDIVLTFQQFGTYYIELVQANACGTVSIMDSICIVAPIEANFTTNVLSGCTPLTVHTTNTPYTPSCIQNDAVYSWVINNVSLGTCPNEGLFPSYVFGTNNSSFEASFLFGSPGIFNIILNATLTNPIPGTLCDATSDTVQVTISQGPNMTFDTYAVCVGDPLQLTNQVQNCYAQATTFNWSFPSPPASQSSSTVQQPTLTFSSPGVHNASVTVTNECGSANFTTPITVSPAPIVTVSGPPSLCVNLPATLSANIVGPATQGVWTVSPALAGLVPSGLNATFNPPLNFTGNVTFTFTTTDAPVECGQVSSSFTVSYDTDATANAGPDMNACLNGSITLNGSIGGSASTATWSSSGGGTFSNPTSLTSTFSPPAGFTGNITLTLTTDDPPGACLQGSDQVVITVVQPPVINITSDIQLCQGTTLPVSATATGFHSGVSWTSPNGTFTPSSTAFSTNFAPTPSFNGQTTITATTTGAAPCPDNSQTINITVHPAPFVANETITICDNGAINFTPSTNPPNSVPANTQYTWTAVANPQISGATSQTIASNSIVQTLSNVSDLAVQSQVYQVQPIATSALNCQGVPFTLTVNVIPTPSVTSPGNLQLCSNQNAVVNFNGVATNYNWSHTNANIADPPLPITGAGNLNFQTAVVTTTETSAFTVTPQFTQNNVVCSGAPINFNISVISAPVTNQVSDLVLCNGQSSGAINFTSSTPGATFSWTAAGDPVGTGPSGNTNPLSFTGSNTTGSTTNVATITTTATFNGCQGVPMSFNVNVLPTVTVTNPQNSQSVCTGGTSNPVTWQSSATAPLSATYSWTITNTGSAISGFSPNGTGPLPSFGPLNLPSGATTPGQLVVTVTPSVNNCPGTPFTYTITVNPLPIMPAITSQTICGGQAFTTPNFTSNLPGTTYSWILQDPTNVPGFITLYPVNGTGPMTGTPINNSGDLPYTLVYSVTPSALGCVGSPQSFSITINPAPTVIFSEQNQTICSGGGTIPVTLSSNTPNVSITWSMVVPNNTTGFGVPGSTQSGTTTIPNYNAVINATTDPIIATFNAQATTTGGNACPGQLTPYTITILPNPTISTVNNILTCSGDQVQPINFVGTGNGFDWVVTVLGGAPSIGLFSGQGMNTPLFTATNTTTSPVTANVQVTPIFTGNNLDCVGGTSNFTITVNPQGQINDVPNSSVCNGNSAPAILFTTNNTSGTTTYNWVNNGAAIGITSPNTNVTSIESFAAVNPGASPLIANIDVTPIYSSGGLSCPGPADNFSITVAPTPLVNPIQDITICSQFQQPQITFGGTGTSYEWNANTNPPVVGNIAPSGTNSIPSFLSVNTPTSVSNTFFVTPIYTIGALNCPGTANSFDILVLLNPVVNQLTNIEICNTECVNATPFVGTGNNYTWTNTNPSIGTGPGGGGLEFPNFCGVNNNAQLVPATGTVTYTPQFIQNGVTCNGASSQFQIIVNPTPSVTPIDDVILCNGNSSNPITISGTASTYSWQVNNTSVGIGLPPSGFDVIPAILGNNGSNSQTNNAIITITPQFSGSGLSCPGVPFDLDVIINPIPEINSVADQTLCFQSQSGTVAFTGTGTSYNWSVSGTPSVGVPTTNGENTIPTFTAANPTNIPISNVVQATPVFTTGNVSCFGTPTSFEIFVLPNPTITQESLASVCNSQPTVPVNYQGTFTSNTWTVASNASLGINTPIPGTGNLPSFTWTNTDNANEHAAQITAVPSFTFNGLTCQGASMTHSISVLPTTVVTPLPNLVFCNGDNSAQFPINATGNSILWNSSIDVGITTGTTYFIPNFIATNTDISQNAPSVVSNVLITPSYTDALGLTCPGTPSSFNITVHPSPFITPISNYTVCNFGTVQQTLSTNIPANISWSSSFNAFIQGNQTTVQNSNIITNGLVNTSPFPGTPQQTTYTTNAVSIPHGCNAVPMQFVVNLMPTVIMTSPSNYEICSGNVVGAVFESNVPSTYTWVAQPPQGVDGASVFPPVTSALINDILINVTNPPTNALVVYNVTPTSIDGSCLGVNQTILVTVTPPPALVSSPTMAMCSGQLANYTFVANTNATFTWFGQNNPNVTGITLNTNNSPVIADQLVNLTGIPQQVTYIVIITATASGGNCSSQPIPVTITVNPLPQVVPLTKEICPNETVTFLLQASEPSHFTWVAENNINVTGETLIPVQSNFIQNTLSNGTYDPQYVYYNVTPTSNSTGCVGPTVQHTAIVNPIPNLAFEMSDILCTENPVTYTINPTTPLNVLWDLGNLVQSNIYNPTTYYEQPGTYVVTLYGINPVTGCENTVFVPVNILLAPPVDFITSSTQECVPAFFQFTNTAQNQGSVLQWNFGDGTISNEQGIADHFYQEAGCYDVTLTAVAQNGCPNSITYENMVCAYNIPIAGFIVNDPIQYGDVNEFLFENLTVFGHTYFWDLGDGTTTNAVHPGHIYPIQRNIYNVTLIAFNEAGCSDTTMYSIQVQERLIFYVPNSFTPDGNTRNEIFQPIFTSGYDIYTYELMIFNRWGEPLFESYNDKVGWDGTYGGVVLPQDTYVWRIRFKLLDDDDFQEYYGHVNLLR